VPHFSHSQTDVYPDLVGVPRLLLWAKRGGDKRREALGVDHKRLLYCVNVNRTSLDHLLLGESADIDQMSNGPSITPE